MAQWSELTGEDKGLIFFVLSSLMVAEERITTKFTGLVAAHGSEEEATFLATQQVDEARHMQFYARLHDEGGGPPREPHGARLPPPLGCERRPPTASYAP